MRSLDFRQSSFRCPVTLSTSSIGPEMKNNNDALYRSNTDTE